MHINPLAVPTFLIAAITFCAGIQAERRLVGNARLPALALAAALSIPGLLYVLYYIHLFDSAAWFYNFRAIRLTELLASGIALLAGWLYSVVAPESLGEKLAIPTALSALLIIPFIKSIITPLDYAQLQDRCEGETCLQSTPSTCGPTSAANILKNFGRSSSEKELAMAAYTYRGGTENWYLSRALRDRGFDTNVVVESPLPERLPAPSVAGVILGGGAGHFIAVLSQDGPVVTIVDPLKGKLVMQRSDLAQQYRFTGFFLAE